MSLTDWVVFEVLALAIAVVVGTYVGITIHFILARLFGWTFNEETGTWQ